MRVGKGVSLICAATPGEYNRLALDMMATAEQFFKPVNRVQTLVLPAKNEPWPQPTITRPSVYLNHWHMVEGEFVFCIDADMRFEERVGEEILGELACTQHPGYVDYAPEHLPYDRNPKSNACVKVGDGERYYAGGFFGGDRHMVADLLGAMEWIIEDDRARGVTPLWHDESALNRACIDSPPTVVLDPSYCHPDQDGFYREAVWKVDYPRRIVALDKSAEQRGMR